MFELLILFSGFCAAAWFYKRILNYLDHIGQDWNDDNNREDW